MESAVPIAAQNNHRGPVNNATLPFALMKCAKIVSEFGYTHLSTGDLLREEQKKESDMATEIADCIR